MLPCRALGGKTWFGQLLLLFSYEAANGVEEEASFIRWFQAFRESPDHAKGFKLQPLKWEVHTVAGMKEGPRKDVIGLDQIIGPCFIQQDPVNPSVYWYNHWVGNTLNDV